MEKLIKDKQCDFFLELTPKDLYLEGSKLIMSERFSNHLGSCERCADLISILGMDVTPAPEIKVGFGIFGDKNVPGYRAASRELAVALSRTRRQNR